MYGSFPIDVSVSPMIEILLRFSLRNNDAINERLSYGNAASHNDYKNYYTFVDIHWSLSVPVSS